MFTTIIVQPIFNLLVLIYAIIPGHNFGLAIIIFTILVRLLMWPLVKKQLNHAKALRELQPELKKIKAASKGDRQKESRLTMELYKEKEINPFASLGIVLVQLPILIGLYLGLKKVIDDPQQIIDFSYPALHHLGWMQQLSKDIHQFDNTLFGIVDLTRKAVGPLYWPALLIAVASGIMQYLQSKQLMPQSKDARGLRQIMREASAGKSADQSEVNAAVTKGTIFFIPALVTLFAIQLPAALPLYWLTSSTVALWQQSRILREDADEADKSVTVSTSTITNETKPKNKRPSTAKKKTANKRRKKK
jgi:YidC/Oxa1 family membrane protein insertase